MALCGPGPGQITQMGTVGRSPDMPVAGHVQKRLDDLRIEALRLASLKFSSDAAVKVAETYFEFLKGQTR